MVRLTEGMVALYGSYTSQSLMPARLYSLTSSVNFVFPQSFSLIASRRILFRAGLLLGKISRRADHVGMGSRL